MIIKKFLITPLYWAIFICSQLRFRNFLSFKEHLKNTPHPSKKGIIFDLMERAFLNHLRKLGSSIGYNAEFRDRLLFQGKP